MSKRKKRKKAQNRTRLANKAESELFSDIGTYVDYGHILTHQVSYVQGWSEPEPERRGTVFVAVDPPYDPPPKPQSKFLKLIIQLLVLCKILEPQPETGQDEI